MDYTHNELALLDLINDINKTFYYLGEDGDDSITFYYLKNDTLTNCQLESTCWYPDMGIEFTIQDTSEVMEEVDV